MSDDEENENTKCKSYSYTFSWLLPKSSILTRDPDDEEVLAISVLQRYFRGYTIRKHMKQLKLARCREMIVKNKYGFRSIPYGFILKNEHQQQFRHTNIVDFTFNSKLGEVIIMDTRGVSTWKRNEKDTIAKRPYLFEKYNSKYLRSITYSDKMGVYYAISKDFAIKVLNKDFEETDEVNAAEGRALFIVVHPTNDDIWSVGPEGVKVWSLVPRPELNWNSVKSMINYWLQKKAEYPNTGGGWASKAWFDSVGKYFIACSETNVVIYNLSGDECYKAENCHVMQITGVDRSDYFDLFITCSEDSTVKVWRPLGVRLRHLTTIYCGKPLTGVKMHVKDDSLVLITTTDGFIKLFSLDTFTELNRIYVCSQPIIKILFTPDKFLVVATHRCCFFYSLNYHYRFWAISRTFAIKMDLLYADHKTTRLQILGSDSSVRLVTRAGNDNYATLLPPPNVPATKKVIGVTCLREYNLMYVLLDEQVVWVYTVRTHPACHIDAWNMARHQEELITALLDGEYPESFVRFPVADDLLYPVVENAYGVISVVACTAISSLNSHVKFYRKHSGYSYTTANIFVLVGLEDGRILFMDPLTSCKKHVDFRPNKHPVQQIRCFGEYNLLCVLSVCTKTKAYISIWEYPDMTLRNQIETENDASCFSLVARSLLAGYCSGVVNVFLWNNTKTRIYDTGRKVALDRFKKAVRKVMIVSTFRKLTPEDLEPDSDEDYVDLEIGQIKRKHTDHLGKVLAIEANHYLQVFLSVGQDDHLIKVWSKSKMLLREIGLDHTLTSACFISDMGDIVFSYSQHLFFMSRKTVFPELGDMRDEVPSIDDVESYVHEASELRFGAVAEHHKKPECLETYLMPFELREEFYKSKDSIIKWAQEGNRKVCYTNNEEQGSESSDTTFASLKADSETYASVDSFAANRYSHWDYLKPPTHLVDDSQSELDSMSELAVSTGANNYTSDIAPQIERMTKVMEQGSVFELPRMASTPTPYSPILKQETGLTAEEEQEQTVVEEKGSDETCSVEAEIGEVQKVVDAQRETESELPKASPLMESPLYEMKAKEPEDIITQLSRSSTALRPRLSIVTARTQLPAVPAKPDFIPSTASQSLATSFKKREGKKSSKAIIERKISSAPKTSVVTKINLKPPDTASAVSTSEPSKPAFPVSQNYTSGRPSRLRKAPTTGSVAPPLPQLEKEKEHGKLTMSSVTEINIEKLPDVLKSVGSISKVQFESLNMKTPAAEVEDKNSQVKEDKEGGTKNGEVEKFSDSKSDDSSIRVVVKRGRRKSESPDKQQGQLNTTMDESQTDLDKSVNTEFQQPLRAPTLGKGDSTLNWVEQKLLKHELKQRLMNQRSQAVKNKKRQDMVKQLKMKQELNSTGTSADAFARMFIDNFMSSWLKFEMPFYSENDFCDFIQTHSSEFANAVSQYSKSENVNANKTDKVDMNFRVPSLRSSEDKVASMPAYDLTGSSLLVDMSGIFSLDESSVFGLDSSRPASTSFALRRPLSRKCKSSLGDSKRRNVRDDRPKTAFPQPQVVLRQHSEEKFKSGSTSLNRVQTSHLSGDGAASKSSKHGVNIVPRSIPSKCTDYVLVKAERMSSFDNPSKIERRLLASRFPNIYEQAVGTSPGLYSVTGNL